MTNELLRLSQAVLDFPSINGPVRALDHVDLEIGERTTTAIVGRSGSGKSSLVSIMAMMRSLSAGEVWFRGDHIVGEAMKSRLRRESIAMVFQSFHLEPRMTVMENVMLHWYMSNDRSHYDDAQRRALDLLDQVGLGHTVRRLAGKLSGGERQRVAIARSLFACPQLLIADEPTGNLDEENAAEVCRLLYGTARSNGSAVVIVTHDRAVASGADRVIEMSRGRVCDEGMVGPT